MLEENQEPTDCPVQTSPVVTFVFDIQGSSQRLDVTSESDSLSQAGQFPITALNTSLSSVIFPPSGDTYSQGAASPISTPNIVKRKSVNDRSVCPDSFSPPQLIISGS